MKSKNKIDWNVLARLKIYSRPNFIIINPLVAEDKSYTTNEF